MRGSRAGVLGASIVLGAIGSWLAARSARASLCRFCGETEQDLTPRQSAGERSIVCGDDKFCQETTVRRSGHGSEARRGSVERFVRGAA
jgi:hypothetical protein